MGQITLQGVRKSFGPVNIIKDANLEIEDGRHRRANPDRRQERGGRAAGQARAVDGVPVLCALSAYERPRQHRVRPEDGRPAAPGYRPQGGGRGRYVESNALSGAQAARPLRRSASARRDWTRHRARAEGISVRRALVESRCGTPRPDAHGGDKTAKAARDHRRLRYA